MPPQENQRRIPDGPVVLVCIIITLGIFAFVRTSEREQRAAEREQPAAASGGVGQAPVTSRPQSVKIEESPRDNERTRERWPYVYRVIDSAAFMDAGNVSRIQTLLVNLYLESGADVRFEFVRGVSGDLASYAHERMQSRGIGREAGGRGMLVVYEMARQELRVEVGPGLARDFPDDFVRYVAREEVARFFASGDRMLGIKAMLFIIANRLRQATLAEQPPAQALATERDSASAWLSAGAGATVAAPLGETRELERIPAASEAVRARFAPQPTVAAVHALYLERLRDGHFEPDLPLFTPNSEGPLRAFPLTRPYADFMLNSEYGQQYRIVERGDLAILYFTTTPFVSSHLFRRSPLGWQLDIGAEVRDTRERIGGAYTWEMVRTGDPYLTTFGDLFVELGGVLRPREGDNRPLSVRSIP